MNQIYIMPSFGLLLVNHSVVVDEKKKRCGLNGSFKAFTYCLHN